MKFFQRRNAANNNNRSAHLDSNNAPSPSIAAAAVAASSSSAAAPTVSMPSRRQRMNLLKKIIHHADAVQKQFIVQKQVDVDVAQDDKNNNSDGTPNKSNNSMSSIFGNDTSEVNNKCYQRWHEILQDGLVPMSVHALNLLEKTDYNNTSAAAVEKDDEEESYFATLEGMEEEIQVMAILARAAALNNIIDDRHDDEKTHDQDELVDDGDGSSVDDAMEQINSSIKCIAMLLFHVVLDASSVGDESSAYNDNNSNKTTTTTTTTTSSVVGYDGRVRHVMKMACVDILTNAILSSVEAYEKMILLSMNGDEKQQTRKEFNDFGNEDHWDIEKIKQFLDLEQLGREAIFGTLWKPSETKEGEKSLAATSSSPDDDITKNNSESDTDDDDESEESRSDIQEDVSTQKEEDVNLKNAANDLGNNDDNSDIIHDNRSEPDSRDDGAAAGGDTCLLSKRQLNAKFLATRKFELVERLVAIDIVRFLMAEEREKKLREQKIDEQSSQLPKLPAFLRNSIDEEEEIDRGYDQNGEEDGESDQSDEEQDPDATAASSSQYFTAARIQRIKRGAKIATAGLAIGTVFAITGGLAAPALAAGIGGIAALTGATTASSTALLAVLATFKAGALLFGAGGGGIAAYKMKKRTQGLSQFEVRRENIEQYMYPGASEEKMKRGIAAMLPQLHTTLAVTGWLRDNDVADFQLAWGIQPTCKYEKADDFNLRIRQMRRFYSIYNPPLVHLCEDFMLSLKSRLKNDFSWDRIWSQLEQKYGANPDHMIPFDTPRENEVFLSSDEKTMIDGVLNTAKVSSLAKRGGLVAGESFEFNENDEIADLLSESWSKPKAKSDIAIDSSNAMQSELSEEITCVDDEYQQDSEQLDSRDSSVGETLSLQERMHSQREQQVSFLKEKGLIVNDTELKEGAGSPKMASSSEDDDQKDEDTEVDDEDDEDHNDGRSPVVWDWNRLYGSDIHTVTWESKMLSSLCHIVENMAIEVSTQATKVALQFSVIGAIVSAVAIPSALLTATKLIDDPYQIVILRADEAGRELAKCLLESDERRPVTLIGFSFGARVIYSCLRELAHQQDIWEQTRAPKVSLDTIDEGRKSKAFGMKKASSVTFQYDREPASLIADVICIGLPRVIDKKVLTSCRRVTGGRFVNCYTTNDWLLSLMFVARAGIPCGVKEILGVAGVENYDVTHFVEAHTNYADAIPSILQFVRLSEP